ncbi:hypothetical protein ABGB14_29575 [Nonomuraea sp. B10E15]|uniref:hypothetical protein n=1 Tax=Nonomuraea sp. B10E15 TaxID=3153560 RepID=UPI00325E0827
MRRILGLVAAAGAAIALTPVAAGPAAADPVNCQKSVNAPARTWGPVQQGCSHRLGTRLSYRWSATARVCVKVRGYVNGKEKGFKAETCGRSGSVSVPWSAGDSAKLVGYRASALRAYSSSDTSSARVTWRTQVYSR